MNKPKICVTIPNLHGAGCERMLSEVLPFYANSFDIDLLILENKISYPIPSNTNVFCLESSNNKSGIFNRGIAFFKTFLKLRKFLLTKKYNAIISYLDTHNCVVYFANKLAHNTKQVACEQTIDYDFIKYSNLSKLKLFLLRSIITFVYNRVSRVIAVSENVKQYLTKELNVNNTITVIHNAVDIGKFNLIPTKNIEFEKEFESAEIKLLTVARFDYQKNIHFLLKCISQICKQIPECKLFILGKGPQENEIKNLIKELELTNNVYLLGFKEFPQEYMKAADVFLFSSRYESFGNVIVEALACGLPVVTTNYGLVVTEILKTDSIVAYIAEQNDVENFVFNVNIVLKQIIGQKNYKEINYNYVLKNFNAIDKSNLYINTIKSVITDCKLD
ncbi:MAG: glycosyltransferase [Saprospiraceae bacterium]|nr:glycosyltransferase [Saprospiraceae bacterium]